ncbi:MAG: DUF4124 domain-containing protein [Candidatus Accumulibacter sp. UW25]
MKVAKLLAILAVTVPFAAAGQTMYKCKTPSGGTLISDTPCASGMRQAQLSPGSSPAPAYPYRSQATMAPDGQAQSSNARLLDAKVAEALGSGDFPRAKGLALTAEHWKMIAAAEQQLRQTVTGRTDADLRAEARNSKECKDAQWSYDVEASSIRNDAAQINSAKRRMYSACGMREPDNVNIDNRTIVQRDRRPPVVAPPQSMRCTPTPGGGMTCW